VSAGTKSLLPVFSGLAAARLQQGQETSFVLRVHIVRAKANELSPQQTDIVEFSFCLENFSE